MHTRIIINITYCVCIMSHMEGDEMEWKDIHIYIDR